MLRGGIGASAGEGAGGPVVNDGRKLYLRIPQGALLLLLALSPYTVPPLRGRFTYIVKHELSLDSADPDPPTGVSLEHFEDPGILVSLAGPLSVDPPWSEELSMDCEDDSPFTPALRVDFGSAAWLSPERVPERFLPRRQCC